MSAPNGHGPHIPAAIYIRVSTERQGERVSPETQLADAHDYAKAHGMVVTAVYRDTDRYRARGRLVEPSGTRSDRPGFQQMLADARAHKFKALIAWKEDRLYRGVRPAVLVDDLIEETALAVHLVRETFDRRMLFIKAAIGRLETDNIRERTAMGHRGRAERGLHYGGRVPHGYRAVKDASGRTVTYEVDPAWRWFFDELAIRYLRRESYEQIAASLGNSPLRGLPWSSASIRFFCINPFYRGLVVTNWMKDNPDFVGKGIHPAAWDEATCEAMAREAARRKTNQNHGPRSASGLFSGIVRCGFCGRLLAINRSTKYRADGTIRHYPSYVCFRPEHIREGQWVGETHAPNHISEAKLLRLVQAELAQLTPAQVDAYLVGLVDLDGAAPDADRLTRLQAEADALSAKLADLTVGLDGIRHASPAAAEAIIAEMRRVGQKLDANRKELGTLERAKVGQPDLGLARAAMLDLIEHPERFERPRGELRPVLQVALPAVYVRGGGLVPPVPEWPYRTRA